MTNRTNSLNNILGSGLLLFGALLSYGRYETAVSELGRFFNSYGGEALGLFASTGLAAARLLQAATLVPAATFSDSLQFLLSCWPVVAIFVGGYLLRNSLRAMALGRLDDEPESGMQKAGR